MDERINFMATKKELNALVTKANGTAERSLAAAKQAMLDASLAVNQAYREGHINGADASGLMDLHDVAYGKCAEALMAIRAAHQKGTKVAIKADPGLAPTGTYADLPELESGVKPMGGGR